MKIWKLKITITKIKSLIDGLNSRMMRTCGKISEMEDRTIEMIPSRVIKDWTFVPLKSQKQKRKKVRAQINPKK